MNAPTRNTVRSHSHGAAVDPPASTEWPEGEGELTSVPPAGGAPHVAAGPAFAPEVPHDGAPNARGDAPSSRGVAPVAQCDASRSQGDPRSAGIAPNGVFPGRYTADNGAEIVVFLIGLRFNGLRGLLPALQAFFKMPSMLAALARKPELGCLGGHTVFGWQTAYLIQYWRSYEDLERFAHAQSEDHFPAWRWYARLGASGRGTGIWHETFRVAAGAYESIYVNMPEFGLAKATAHRSLAKGSSSRERITNAPANA